MNRKALTPVLLLLLAVCVAFGWAQNHFAPVGGEISAPKVLWLHLAVACFLVIPAFLWRGVGIADEVRRLYGWFLAGFVLRAAIELPFLYFTRGWRCSYGIAHDGVMILAVLVLWWRARFVPASSAATRLALQFVPLLLVALIFEILNAWLFSRAANPVDGIYFAGNGAAFRMINFITWTEVLTLGPCLCWWTARWNTLSSGEA